LKGRPKGKQQLTFGQVTQNQHVIFPSP